MRIHLTLTPPGDRGHMPINYNSYVSEFVYEAIQPDLAFRGQHGPDEGIAFYTFSNLYIPEVQQEDRVLNFGKVGIELTISMLIEPAFEVELIERIEKVKTLPFDPSVGTDLDVSRVEIVNEAPTVQNYARFRMLSPLASPLWNPAPGTEQRYIHYGEDEFSESIRGILLAKYEKWKGRRPIDTRFRFELDEKYVQRRRGRISKLVTFHEGEPDEKRVKAIVAPFEVEGNPELIWLGYVAGFGEKNLLGFGCADLVSTSQGQIRHFEDRPPAQHFDDRRTFRNNTPRPERTDWNPEPQRRERSYEPQPHNGRRENSNQLVVHLKNGHAEDREESSRGVSNDSAGPAGRIKQR